MAAILMVFTFLAFLVTDIILRRVQAKKALATAESSAEFAPGIPFGLKAEDMALPAGLFFHQGHTWAGIDTSGSIKIGLDDFIQKVLGRIDSVKSIKVGDAVEQGEKLFTIQQGERKAEFNSPVEGVISSVNEEVIKNPNLLKEKPYENGWIYSIKPTNLQDDIKTLTIATEAKNWLKYEVQRFKDFIAEQFVQDKMLGKTMADGGLPVEGVMEHMDDFSWMKLQEDFLAK
jgi:glycine cleavage system H protein